MTIDYYEEARAIINALTNQGLASDADMLSAAIDGGATANEILMALRWHLKELDAANKPMDFGTRKQVRDLINELNAVLS